MIHSVKYKNVTENNYTRVPKRHKHKGCANDVDTECGCHLSASSSEPGPELLDAVIPLVPVREGGGVVDVLQDVDELVDVVSPPPELGGCQDLNNKNA